MGTVRRGTEWTCSGVLLDLACVCVCVPVLCGGVLFFVLPYRGIGRSAVARSAPSSPQLSLLVFPLASL